MYENCCNPELIFSNPLSNEIVDKFEKQLQFLDNDNNKTLKLWIMYFRMASILNDFLYAERTGDWDLHFKIIELMIPFPYIGTFSHTPSRLLFTYKI